MSDEVDKLVEWVAKYQMELYLKSKGWEKEDWNDLCDEVQSKYRDEAKQILSHLAEALKEAWG